MRMAIKPIDVSIYCLHIMNCTLSQLLRCQRIIKCTAKAICDLRQINIRRCTLNGMSRYGLNSHKLTKHSLRQISHHAVSASQPSRVKADSVKRTCLTVISILIQYRGKNRTNYLHAYRNRTNLPCDVCQGLKCSAFEQYFTDFVWIFAVRILRLEGKREKVKSETVKMGGEQHFILRIRPKYVIHTRC